MADGGLAETEFWKKKSQAILDNYQAEAAEVQKQRTEVFESQQNNDRYG